jgi:hypothetical protein
MMMMMWWRRTRRRRRKGRTRNLYFYNGQIKDYPWFQASAAMPMRLRSFWHRPTAQRRVLILYRRFGTTYRSHIQGSRNPRRKEARKRDFSSWTSWPLKMGRMRCPETSVKD